jgi:hypothetical protein
MSNLLEDFCYKHSSLFVAAVSDDKEKSDIIPAAFQIECSTYGLQKEGYTR